MSAEWKLFLNWIQNGGENILIMIGVGLLIFGILFAMIASGKTVKALSAIVVITGALFIIVALACHVQIHPEDMEKIQPQPSSNIAVTTEELSVAVANDKENQTDTNELQGENEESGFHIGALSIVAFIIIGITMVVAHLGLNSYPIDEDVPLKIAACILLSMIMATVLIFADRGLYRIEENEKRAQIEANEKLATAVQDDYQILVDGVEFESVDDIEITNYKTTYDNAGKKVILTSRTESSSDNSFIIYIVLFMAFWSLFYWGKSKG